MKLLVFLYLLMFLLDSFCCKKHLKKRKVAYIERMMKFLFPVIFLNIFFIVFIGIYIVFGSNYSELIISDVFRLENALYYMMFIPKFIYNNYVFINIILFGCVLILYFINFKKEFKNE